MENSKEHVSFEGLILGFALVVVPTLFLWPFSEGRAGWSGLGVLLAGGLIVAGSSRVAAAPVRSVLFGIGVGTVFLGAGGVAGSVLEIVGGASKLR